jgi:acyl carrier protein
MSVDEIIRKVREYVAVQFLEPEDRGSLTESTPLVTGGILDSLASLKLAGFLEKEFGVKVQSYELNVDNFDSLGAIAALVLKKLGSS